MIKIQDFSFSYNDKLYPALDDINIEIPKNKFIIITGKSGSGKSTFIRLFNGLIPNFYGGTYKGKVLIGDLEVVLYHTRDLATKVGMVFQNPDNQLFMNSVEAEIAFGLENLGVPSKEISLKINKTLRTLNITHLKHRMISELSGGEKQKVAIAAMLAMEPDILLLDEPTAELDPISSQEIMNALSNLQKRLKITLFVVEHRLDRIWQYMDLLLILDHGKITFFGESKDLFKVENLPKGIAFPFWFNLSHSYHRNQHHLDLIPNSFKDIEPLLPNLLKMTKDRISSEIKELNDFNHSTEEIISDKQNTLIEFKNVSYHYPQNDFLLNNINFKANSGEFITIVGQNGAGKTTFLKLIMKLLKPDRGTIIIDKIPIKDQKFNQLAQKIGFLFQNPSIQFYRDTVEEELRSVLKNFKYSNPQIKNLISENLSFFDLGQYIDTYPRYLSVGEQQRVALATILTRHPKILLLDEPTHGMDAEQKLKFFSYLKQYQRKGNTIIIATHDIDHIISYSTRTILFENGNIIQDDSPEQFFENYSEFIPQFSEFKQNQWSMLQIIQALGLNTNSEDYC
ncbi:MAG: ABC transporter ATP-binding protein [Promethearchaeota archaeon]